MMAVAPTCSRAGPRGRGSLSGRAVQKVVSLQEPVEGTEDGGVEHDGQGDGTSPGQSGEDKAPAGDTSELKLDAPPQAPPTWPQAPPTGATKN